jgi:hypothetical protein
MLETPKALSTLILVKILMMVRKRAMDNQQVNSIDQLLYLPLPIFTNLIITTFVSTL